MSEQKISNEINKLLNYMIKVDVPDGEVPLEVLIAFPKALEDENFRERLRRMWLIGNNREYAQLAFLKTRNNEMVFRPTSIKVDFVRNVIVLKAPNRAKLLLSPAKLKDIGNDIEEVLMALSDYVWVSAYRRKKTLIISKIKPLHGTINIEKAKEVLETVDLTPLEILCLGLGYKWNLNVFRLLYPRLMLWFKGFDGRPIHIAQFTQPNSGKTHFGLRSETLFNFEYLNEVPTKARLIMDSRSGELGIVYLRDGVIFDEFDKWHISVLRVMQVYENLLTGMEQGKWVRGTTKAVAEAPDIRRWLPIGFFGNLGDLAEYRQIRADFIKTYTTLLNVDASPLCDRLALIDICTEEIPITEYVSGYVLPDSVLRGIVKLVQERCKPANESSLKGRANRHSNVITSLTRALGFDVKAEVIDTIVSGNDSLDFQFNEIWKTRTEGE